MINNCFFKWIILENKPWHCNVNILVSQELFNDEFIIICSCTTTYICWIATMNRNCWWEMSLYFFASLWC